MLLAAGKCVILGVESRGHLEGVRGVCLMAAEEDREADPAHVEKRDGRRGSRVSDAGKSEGSRRNRKSIPPALEAVLAEDSAELEARIAAWVADYQPCGPADLTLVQRAAQLSWKLDRLNQYETDVLSAKVRDAVRRVDEARHNRIEAIASTLVPPAGKPESDGNEGRMPSELVRELEAAAEGCGWLIQSWRSLREAIEERGDAWTDAQEWTVARLLGADRGDALDSDLFDLVVANRVLRGARRWREGLSSTGAGERVPAWEEAIAVLLAGIGRILARLEALRVDRERDGSAENARKTAANLASFDPSPEGERLRRYQHATHREFLKAVEALATLRSRQRGRRPGKA